MVYEYYEQWKTIPVSDNPHLSIVIPAYNEEERIVPTVGAIAAYVSSLGFEWELIVADDGSTDDTVKLLQELELVNLRVLIAAKNGGKGSAVRRGMLAARGDYVLFTDADNSTPIENVTPMLKKLTDDGFDVAVGSRAADGASESNKSFFRHLMSGGLRLLVRYVLNIRVKDTQCGFKLYSKEVAQKLHRQQTIDGFSFDLESLYLAAKYGYKVVEVPVEWMDAPGSKVDAKKEAIRFLKDMTRIRLNDLKGIYSKPPTNLPIIDASDMTVSTEKKLLNIAVVSPYPPSKSSLNEYGYHFITALRKKPEIGQIYILSDELPEGEYYQPITDEGAPTSIISCWKFGAINNATRIQSAVNTLKPDVVLFNIQFASFAGSRIAGAFGLLSPMLVKYMSRIPTVVLLHNIMETVDLSSAGFGGSNLMELVTRKAGEWATRAILSADLVALTIPKYVEILNEKYKAKNVFLAPHGAFDDVPEPDFSDSNNGKLNIMTFGKFGTYKKVEPLIEAFSKLKESQREQELELVIAGSDSPNVKGYLENVKHQYSNIDGITYTGYVAEEDVPRLFQESDVVVFPYTSTTGSSGVLHQAGSFGCAAVLPNFGDFAEIIKEEGYTGVFFEPNDVDSLTEAIETLLSSPEMRKEQGQQNYLAAKGIPIDDVVDWYLMHAERYLKD